MKRILQSAMLALMLVVAACASRAATGEQRTPAEAGTDRMSPDAMSGADHAAHHHHGPALPATAGPGYTAADVRFMQAMIGHHAQALTMTALAASRGRTRHVLQLAEKIDISQRDEIDMMKAWLVERNQAVPDAAHMHDMRMPGMVSAEQLAQLEAARGTDFDRLFLWLMIHHHEGALEMVEELFASPGAAQDSDIFRFATDVAADQRDEIDVMYHMLDMLDATQGSETR